MWLNLLEYHSVDGKVMGLVPGQGTHLGSRFVPQVRVHTRSNQSMFLFKSMFILSLSLSLSLSLPLSLTLLLSLKTEIKIKENYIE